MKTKGKKNKGNKMSEGELWKRQMKEKKKGGGLG